MEAVVENFGGVPLAFFLGLFAFGDVGKGAAHALGLVGLIPFRHLASIQHPNPVALAVAQPYFTVEGRTQAR